MFFTVTTTVEGSGATSPTHRTRDFYCTHESAAALLRGTLARSTARMSVFRFMLKIMLPVIQTRGMARPPVVVRLWSPCDQEQPRCSEPHYIDPFNVQGCSLLSLLEHVVII